MIEQNCCLCSLLLCNEITTHFGWFARILQSDKPKECYSTAFQSFLSSRGIVHQTSCSYASQQNGVVGRKIRHLVEMAYTLLVYMHVPILFWDAAILTSCYPISRMLSTVLHGVIHHALPFPQEPLYPLSLFHLFSASPCTGGVNLLP